MSDDPNSADGPFEPRRNPDLVGHEAAEARFLAAWRSGRLPHGWLITGPRGVGKATLAFRIARYVLSGGSAPAPGLFGDAAHDSLHVDPDHPVFRRVAAGSHADLMTLQRSINPETKRLRTVIVVEDVRAAGEFLRLTPSEGGWRIVVVDSADELNANAANALLKMLEEPPERALLLLVSHAPGRLLPTIRSRCCRMTLNRLPDDAVGALLDRLRPDLPADDRLALARLAEGSPGRALVLADAEGLALYREMVSLLAQLPHPPVAALHGFADRLGRRGAEDRFRTATDLMAWWLGRLAGAGARGHREPTAVIPEEAGCGTRLLSAAGLDRWIEVWEKVTRLSERTDGLNLDRKQVVLNMFHELGETARASQRGTDR